MSTKKFTSSGSKSLFARSTMNSTLHGASACRSGTCGRGSPLRRRRKWPPCDRGGGYRPGPVRRGSPARSISRGVPGSPLRGRELRRFRRRFSGTVAGRRAVPGATTSHCTQGKDTATRRRHARRSRTTASGRAAQDTRRPPAGCADGNVFRTCGAAPTCVSRLHHK